MRGMRLGSCPLSPSPGTSGAGWGERLLVLGSICIILLSGCAGPSKANIQLRKDKQQLEDQVQSLKSRLEAERARVLGLEQHAGTIPTLPDSRLQKLFTTHAIQLGRLTGGAYLNPNKFGDEGLRVYLQPLDASGDILKSTGAVTVEAFDLAGPTRIGRWTFTPEQMKKAWVSFGLLRTFEFDCPWQTMPTRPDLLIKVTFQDELTGAIFTATKDVKVQLQPATKPAQGS